MIVRSRTITLDDVYRAVRQAPAVTFQNTFAREGWFVPVREFTARDGRSGFEFFLSGSSPYRAQHDREEFAATWTEWGVVIDVLFEVDPSAHVGFYKGRDEFVRFTRREVERGFRKPAEAPWLAPWLAEVA